MIRRLVALMVGALATMLLVAAPASAHTTLESSSPADDAKVTGVPPSIVLTFGEPLQGTTADAGVLIGKNNPVRVKAAVDGATVTIDTSLPAIADIAAKGADGKWAIGYQVISADGHPIDGTISFTVTGTGKSAGGPSGDTAKKDASPQQDSSQVAPWLWALILLASAGAVFAVVKIDRARRKRKALEANGAEANGAADDGAADDEAADDEAQ